MTGKEKIKAAFEKDGTPEFPVVICYEGIFIRDHWSELTSHPWYTVYLPDINKQADCYTEIISKIDQDWFVVYPFYSRQERKTIKVEIHENEILMTDAFRNTKRIRKPSVAGWSVSGQLQSVRVSKIPETITELEKLLPEQASEFDRKSFLSQGRHELAQSLINRFPDKIPICHVASPLWRLYGTVGFEGMMTMMATEPDLVRYACNRFLDISINLVQQEISSGAEIIWIEECLTDMISPPAFEKFNIPFMKKLVQTIRDLGAKSVYYYCGNPWDRIERIFDIGADALSFEESKKNFQIDIEKIVEAVDGRFVVLGNLDAINILPHADIEKLTTEIKRQLDAGKKNKRRFIMSLGSPVTPETDLNRLHTYLEISRKAGGA